MERDPAFIQPVDPRVRALYERTCLNNDAWFPPGPKRMRISNTAECQAADGSCSLRADCDITLNNFQGMCDNTTFGCCISNDIVCAARNGTCLSEVDCEAVDDHRVSRMACSADEVCCMPKMGCKGGHRGGSRRGRGHGSGSDSESGSESESQSQSESESE